MTGLPGRPSRVWLALLERVTHPQDRPWVRADAVEAFDERVARDGLPAARRWLRRQAVSALAPGLRERWRRRGRPASERGPSSLSGMARVGEDARRDLAHALRGLRRAPGLVVLVVGSLGAGIGATTLVFSIASALIFPDAGPLGTPETLVTVYESDPEGGLWGEVAFPNFLDLRSEVPGLDDAAATRMGVLRMGGSADGETVMVELVTGNYFDVLQVPAVLGRTFAPGETVIGAAEPLIVISREFWERRFAADPAVLGRTVLLDGRRHTIIGVAPSGMTTRTLQIKVAGWVPLGIPGGTYNASEDELANRADREYSVLGRLAPGTSITQVAGQVAALGVSVGERFPDIWRDDRGQARRFSVLSEEESRLAPDFRAVGSFLVGLLLAGTGLILAVACSNVAGLLLARGQRRAEEVAVRMSVGASRGRIVRMLMTESLLLATMGGLLGVALTGAVVRRGAAIPLPGALPDLVFDLHVDGAVLAFALTVATVSALAFGLAPAFVAARSGSPLGRGARGVSARSRGRRALVAVQVAASVVFLMGAGLLMRSVGEIASSDPGLDTKPLAVVNWKKPADASGDAWMQAFRDELLSEDDISRVELASAVEVSPFSDLSGARVLVPGQSESIVISLNSVTPGYADLVGLDLRRGRWLSDRDRSGSSLSVVVNEAFVRTYFPDDDPVGRSFRIEERRALSTPVPGPSLDAAIVGVVEDVRNDPTRAPTPYLWASIEQLPVDNVVAHVRGPRGPAAAVEALRRRTRDQVSLIGPSPYDDVASLSTAWQRAVARLLGVGGLFATGLTVIGLGGLLSVSVAMRLPELAIRRALGASSRDVVGDVIGESARLTGAGILGGLLIAIPLAVLARRVLPGVSAVDPIATLGTVLVLIASALLTAVPPALTAARVHPLRYLRGE